MKFRDEYWFLSNFYPVHITYQGETYPTAEHAYQAAKTNVRHEKWAICYIAKTPGEAKKMGRSLTLKKNWTKLKLKVMEDILRIKFNNPDLRKKLLTIEDEIVEENDWDDTYWGICDGIGRNILGKLLMKIRDELLEEENDATN